MTGRIGDATGADLPVLAGILSDWTDAAKAAEAHLALWTFQAHAGARAFYAQAGFRETLLTDGAGSQERLPDVLLEWRR